MMKGLALLQAQVRKRKFLVCPLYPFTHELLDACSELRSLLSPPSNAQRVLNSTGKVKVSTLLKPPPPVRHKVVPGPRGNGNKDVRSIGGNMLFQTKSSAELAFDIEELKIHWDDLVIKERIGAGTKVWWL